MEPEKKAAPPGRKYLIFTAEILILILILLGTVWIVNKLKKPGQMTVIESQAMDMTTMIPPVGSFPVSTSTVISKKLMAKASTYGTIVAYNEVDIYPRVTGRLVYMPFYPGDRVQAGELLAELDRAELMSRVNEAAMGARVAEGEKASLKEKKESLAFERKAASHEEKVNQAELKDVQADLQYWKGEYEREKTLYAEGAISKDEFQMEEAKYRSALAREEAAVNKIFAARNRLDSITHQEYAVGADLQKQQSAVEQAMATKETASIIQGYTRIQAPFPALIMSRQAAPGALLSPGTSILKIADIRKVRVQALLSEKDLSQISRGSTLEYAVSGDSAKWRTASVTSIFPSIDPKARTGIVEAIVDNDRGILLPGAYVHVRVTLKKELSAVAVPSRAVVPSMDVQNHPGLWIVRDDGEGKVTQYTCSMHPQIISDLKGLCPICKMELIPRKHTGGLHAYIVPVRTGLSDGDYTQILEGVKDGDVVAVDGIEDLQNGAAVFPTKWGAEGPEELPPPPGGMPGHQHGTSTEMPGMPGMEPPSPSPPGVTPSVPTDRTKKPAGKNLYTCPMHPEVISDAPGRCPKCGMDLVPK